MSAQSRSRWMFVGVVALFALPFLFAAVLRFGGWQPANTRNYGELLQPPIAIASGAFLTPDGTPYHWRPEDRRWHLVLLPSSACSSNCVDKADVMRRVWISEGRLAEKLDVLWMGEWPPALQRFGGLREVRLNAAPPPALVAPPVADQLTAALIDHNGFLVMHYPLDFDPSGVRKDLGRLVK